MNQDTNNTMDYVKNDDQHFVDVKATVSFKLPDSLVDLKSEKTQHNVSEKLDELKDAFEYKFQFMEKSLSCTNDTLKSMKESINCTNDTLKSMKESISSMEDTLKSIAKKQEFDMALACVHLNSFSYKDTLSNDHPSTSISSTELVKNIMKWLQFCPGGSYNVSSDNYMISSNSRDLNDNTRKAFRDALKKQLTTLFGHAPRFGEIRAENNTFQVYYK